MEEGSERGWTARGRGSCRRFVLLESNLEGERQWKMALEWNIRHT